MIEFTLLQSQESYYNSKVDVVKEEHKKLLQEAFERAKVPFAVFPIILRVLHLFRVKLEKNMLKNYKHFEGLLALLLNRFKP